MRVLIVENDPHMAQGLRFNVEREGFAVTCTETLDEALQDAACHDLMVLDAELASGDGQALLGRVQRQAPALQVLLLTTSETDTRRAREARPFTARTMSKPFVLEDFLKCLRDMRQQVLAAQGGHGVA